jgi:hypothetical protein
MCYCLAVQETKQKGINMNNYKGNQVECFKVMVDDNFDFMDDDGCVCIGRFDSYGEALQIAQNIVIESLNSTQGTTAEEIYEHYTLIGEDPLIVTEPCTEMAEDRFSVWKFAMAESERIAQVRSKKI